MKIVIMGLGIYPKGSGISAAKFFILRNDDVLITDLKTRRELAHQIKEIEKFCKKNKKKLPKYILGEHRKDDFKKVDIVMRNPGVRSDSPYLKIARKTGAKIETDISVFLKHCDAMIVGITGTRGKSTTTTLIYEMLRKKHPQVWLGGNIKISPLSFIENVSPCDFVILELSSWMLENFKEFKLAPQIAVVTNIYPDHLNMHKNMAEYISAKKNIFRCQKAHDFLIVNRNNQETKKWKGQGETIYFSKKDVPKYKTNLKGEHNLENIAAALAVAKIMKIKKEDIKCVLKEFKGLSDRQEVIAKQKDVIFVNDTTATTPDGAIAGLRTFGKKKNIILICGGKDKELEYDKLAKEIKKYCKAVILFPGTATDKIYKEFKKIKFNQFIEVKNMRDAVARARDLAEKGDTVMLSPAAASFGLFKNEFDRGEQFKKAVKQ